MPQKSTRAKKFKNLGLAVGLGAAVGLGLLRYKSKPKNLPNLGIWQKLEKGQRNQPEIHRIASLMQANYERLYNERTKVSHPALQFHQERNILAALAMYQVLLQEGVNQAVALEQIENVFRRAMAPVLRVYALQKYLPNAFSLMQQGAKTSMKYIFPEVGFQMEWLENSQEKVAFNIQGCFYLESFKANGAPELTAVFCKLDDVLFEQLPPSIRWERTTTLGRGGEVCNFQWSNVDVSGKKSLKVIQP